MIGQEVTINNRIILNSPLHYSREIIKQVISRFDDCFNLGILILYMNIQKTDLPFNFQGIDIFFKYCPNVGFGLMLSKSI